MLTPGAGGQHHKKFLVTCVGEPCSAEILVGLEDFQPAIKHTLRKSAHVNTAPRGHMEHRERNQKQGEEEEAESVQNMGPHLLSPPQRKYKRLEENQNTKILLLFFFFNFYDVVLVSATQQSNQP